MTGTKVEKSVSRIGDMAAKVTAIVTLLALVTSSILFFAGLATKKEVATKADVQQVQRIEETLNSIKTDLKVNEAQHTALYNELKELKGTANLILRANGLKPVPQLGTNCTNSQTSFPVATLGIDTIDSVDSIGAIATDPKFAVDTYQPISTCAADTTIATIAQDPGISK